MDKFNSKVIQIICAELIGTLTISSILLSGSKLSSIELHRNETRQRESEVHDFLEAERLRSSESTIVTEAIVAKGLLITSAVTYTFCISGGHLNPAVTLGAIICGYTRIFTGLCYIFAHLIGALLGEVLATLIVEKQKHEKLELRPPLFGFGVLVSFLFVSVYLSVADPRRLRQDVGSAPLTTGVAVTVMAMSEYKLGICMNPAISLATSVYYEDFGHEWKYWTAPLLGGLLAGVVYRILVKYYEASLIRVERAGSIVTITTNGANTNKEVAFA